MAARAVVQKADKRDRRNGNGNGNNAKAATRRKRTPEDRFEELRSMVRRYEATYLECRDLGHPWTLRSVHKAEAAYIRETMCPRCSTTRYEEYSLHGAIRMRSYAYPATYKLEGTARSDRPYLRALALESAVASSS